MAMNPTEVPLDEGGLEPGRVVRVAATVRRPAGRWTPSCHHLMRFLRQNGLEFVPEPHGIDERGREIITYIPGHGQGWPYAGPITDLDGVTALGATTTRLRHALGVYPCPPDAVWQFSTGKPPEGESLQHGDLGPWNLLWNSGPAPVGVIDWDMVDIGNPFYGTGTLAWFVVPFMNDERARQRGFGEIPDRAARLAAFSRGAGLDTREIVAHGLAAQQEFIRRVRTRCHLEGIWRTLAERRHDESAVADHAWTSQQFGEPV